MSVTRTGSITEIQSTANSGSQSVTVPADAELMCVGVTGISNAGLWDIFSNPPTIGGNAMSIRRDDDGTGNRVQNAIHTYTNPPTGSQTFAWDWAGTSAILVGAKIYIAFYKGVDTTTPVGATGGAQDLDSAATTGSLTAANGDAIFSVAGAYRDSTPTDIAWTNATELDDDNYNNLRGSLAEAFPTGDVTVTATQSGGSGSNIATTVSAIVIKQAAGGGGSSVGPLIGGKLVNHGILQGRLVR